jgi:hypothetical protein
MSACVDEHILWFDITMHNTMHVNQGDRLKELLQQPPKECAFFVFREEIDVCADDPKCTRERRKSWRWLKVLLQRLVRAGASSPNAVVNPIHGRDTKEGCEMP